MCVRVGGSGAKAKARPIPGNSPHDRLVSRGLCSPRRDCGDPFSATVFQPQNILSAQYAFLRHGGIYLVRWSFKIKTKPRGGTVPPPAGRSRTRVKERVGRTALLLIVRR